MNFDLDMNKIFNGYVDAKVKRFSYFCGVKKGKVYFCKGIKVFTLAHRVYSLNF